MMNKVYFLYEIYAEIYADNIKAINGIAVQQLFWVILNNLTK